MSQKFRLKGSIYDVDIIASIVEMRTPLPDRYGGEPVTHVMHFKEDYVYHESMRKGIFLQEKEALEICVLCLKKEDVKNESTESGVVTISKKKRDK